MGFWAQLPCWYWGTPGQSLAGEGTEVDHDQQGCHCMSHDTLRLWDPFAAMTTGILWGMGWRACSEGCWTSCWSEISQAPAPCGPSKLVKPSLLPEALSPESCFLAVCKIKSAWTVFRNQYVPGIFCFFLFLIFEPYPMALRLLLGLCSEITSGSEREHWDKTLALHAEAWLFESWHPARSNF